MPEVRRRLAYERGGVSHNGEIRTTTKSGRELRGISKERDFLILCKKGKNPSRLSDLRNHLGEGWFVGALKGDIKKYEILRDFGKYYWAHKGWDKRKLIKSDRFDACRKKVLMNFSTADDFLEVLSLDFFESNNWFSKLIRFESLSRFIKYLRTFM